MQPWNLKVKKIGRGYFFIALICCLFLTGTGELLTIMTPHSEKVVDVSVDEQNSTVINTRTVNHEGRWVFFMILYDFFVVLRWLYLISLIIKRYHDAGYSTTYAVVSMLLILVIIGIFIIFHVAVMPGEKP
jgi:hypothetical protein